MARQRTRQPEPPNGFVASAVSLPADTSAEAGRRERWQTQAWDLYDSVGELRYLANWIGNVMSRATLHAAKREGNALVPVTSGPAREAMDALYGGPQNQPEMIKLLGIDMTVGGEGYPLSHEGKWAVVATGNVTQTGTGDKRRLHVDLGGEKNRVELNPNAGDFVMRVWTPHPQDATKADAPTRSNLRVLKQILGYDNHISAQLESRLAGNGILFLPSEINFGADPEADADAPQASSFMQTLAATMTKAKDTAGHPASLVPIVVMAPGDELEKVQHLKLWSDLDDSVIEMRAAAIRRFAIGMDVPPETLMGNAEQNHWNAWLSEESAIKAHLEPRLAVINAATTTHYLRPAIQGQTGIGNVDDYYVIADTSEIRTRPNRSTEALEMHDRGILSVAALLRETGFKSEDESDDAEKIQWLLKRIAHGAVSPELSAAALRELGAPITVVDAVPQEQPTHTKSDLEVNDDGQVGGIPKIEDAVGLQAAAEVLVFRALERAGNRLKNKHPMTDVSAMAAHKIYMTLNGDEGELLTGAWDCAGEVLAPHTSNVEEVVGVLDFYARGLLSQKRAHNPKTLSLLLEDITRS